MSTILMGRFPMLLTCVSHSIPVVSYIRFILFLCNISYVVEKEVRTEYFVKGKFANITPLASSSPMLFGSNGFGILCTGWFGYAK